MGFSGMIRYDSAGPTMSQQNCLLHTRRARHWSFRRWTNFTRGTRSWAEGICLEPSIFTKLEEIRARKTESLEPGVSKLWRLRLYWVALVSLVQSFIPGSKIRKTMSLQASSPQASSLKHKRTSFPTFRNWWVGGPIGHKLANRGSWVKFDGPWNGGLD